MFCLGLPFEFGFSGPTKNMLRIIFELLIFFKKPLLSSSLAVIVQGARLVMQIKLYVKYLLYVVSIVHMADHVLFTYLSEEP